MSERVPTDPSYAATNACGDDIKPLHSPGIPGHPACHVRACEYPVLGILEASLASPIQERLSQRRIKRDARVGVFGFDIAYYPGDDASPHEERKVIPEHVTPLESEELAARAYRFGGSAQSTIPASPGSALALRLRLSVLARSELYPTLAAAALSGVARSQAYLVDRFYRQTIADF